MSNAGQRRGVQVKYLRIGDGIGRSGAECASISASAGASNVDDERLHEQRTVQAGMRAGWRQGTPAMSRNLEDELSGMPMPVPGSCPEHHRP